MRIDESKKPLVIMVCVIAIIVSFVSILRTSCRSGVPPYKKEVDVCVGEVIAGQVAKLLEGKGGDIVVVTMAGSPQFKNMVAEAQMEGFKKGLLQHPTVRIVATVGPDQKAMMEYVEGVPEKQFMKYIESYPKAKLIVSFMGLPVLAREGAPIDPTKLPKIIAFNLSAMGRWKQLLEDGIVTEVISPRYDVRYDQLPKQTVCKEMFDSRYYVINKDNLEAMVEKLSKFMPVM